MLSAARLRLLSWALMAVVAVGALVYGATDDAAPRTDAERSAALASTIACPVCSGQPVSESNATIAEEIRTQIKQLVDEGRTDAEIRQVYIDQYGEWVDLTPSRSGLTGLVWVAPFLAIGAAVGALALAFSRWQGNATPVRATADDRALVEAAMGEAPGVPEDE